MKYNFAKLLLSGGRVPKYQDTPGALPTPDIMSNPYQWYIDQWKFKKLKGWNERLDASKATTIKNAYHGHAGNLNVAAKANADYIANPNMVGQDIQSFIDNNQFGSIDDFLNTYNSNIDQINSYFNNEIGYGDDASEHNPLFKQMYSSRSTEYNNGINGNIGYQEGLENKAGSSTWLRRGDLYEKAFADLTDSEKQNRIHQITIGDLTYTVYKEKDGKLYKVPNELGGTTTTIEREEEIPGDKGGSSTEQVTETSTGGSGYTPLDFDYYGEAPKPDPWTDWIPLSAQYGNDLISAWRQRNLQARMKFPLIEGPYKNKIVTNAYAQRAAMGLNAADLRYRAGLMNGSDIVTNMANMNAADANAAQIENLAEQIKSEKDAQERREFEETVNENKETAAEVANYNRRSNIMAYNNILDAHRRFDLAKTQATNSYIGNMYTSHGEWLKDARLNEYGYLKGLNSAMANKKLLMAADTYQNAQDYTKSDAYNVFKTELSKDLNQIPGLTSEEISILSGDDEAKKEEIYKSLFIGNSDFAKHYQKQFESSKDAAYNNYMNEYRLISSWLDAMNRRFPVKISNQGIFYSPSKWSTINPYLWGDGIGYHSKGGSVRSRFVDYAEHMRKEQQDQRKSLHKRNELSNKKLTSDLDRLSREQLILLKSIFK